VRPDGNLGGSPTSTTEIIDLNTARVSPGPAMGYDRAEFPTIVLPDGDVVVFGGCSTNGGGSVVERYDVETETWSVIGNINGPRRQHCTAEIFTISTGKSERVVDIPGSANSAVSINPDGRGPSFWGYREGGAGSVRPRESIRYSKATGAWTKDLVFDDSPVAPKLVTLADGSVLVISGATNEAPFVTSTRTWTVSPFGEVARGPNLLAGRQWHSVGTWDQDRILVAGGLVDGASITTSCEWLELSNDRSVPAPFLNVERSFGQMIMARSADGRMRAFAISGLGYGRNTPSVEILEDSTCTNSTTPILYGDLRLAGSARQVSSSIQLTTNEQFQSGAAWLKNKLPVSAGFEFRFKFRLS